MALEAYAITSLEKVKNYLNIGATNTDKDSFLEELINSVSGFVETYCQRVFAVQSFSNEIHNGNGRCKIRTLYYPIVQLSVETDPSDAQILASVQEREDLDSAWTDIETNVNNLLINNPRDYQLTSQNSHNIELADGVFTEGNRNIRLSYKAGLTSPDIDEIENLVIEMVAMRYKESSRGNSQLGQTQLNQNNAGQSSSVNLKDMKPEWMSVLKRYKRKF